MRTKLKNLLSGTTTEKTFRAGIEMPELLPQAVKDFPRGVSMVPSRRWRTKPLRAHILAARDFFVNPSSLGNGTRRVADVPTNGVSEVFVPLRNQLFACHTLCPGVLAKRGNCVVLSFFGKVDRLEVYHSADKVIFLALLE